MGEILTKLARGGKKTSGRPMPPPSGIVLSGWKVSPSQDIKIVVCGSGGVGKSAFTIQFVSNHFVEEYDPTIEDSYRKQHHVDGDIAMMEILDTAGQEEFSAMRDQWFRQGDAFIMLYSINARSTFEEVRKLYDNILKAKDASAAGPMILVGNKSDLDQQQMRQVSTQEGRELAKQLGIPFLEASAKLRINIDESFYEVVRLSRTAKAMQAADRRR